MASVYNSRTACSPFEYRAGKNSLFNGLTSRESRKPTKFFTPGYGLSFFHLAHAPMQLNHSPPCPAQAHGLHQSFKAFNH